MKYLNFFRVLSFLWLGLPLFCYSQPDPIRAEMEQLFAPLDKSQVPSRLLYEYGNTYLPEGCLDGTLTDTNQVNLGIWRLAYASFTTAHCSGKNPLPGLETVNARIKNYNPPGNAARPISVPVFLIDYHRLDPQALEKNLLRYDSLRRQFVDVAGRRHSPYQARRSFAAAPVRSRSQDEKARFIFRPDLVFGNTGLGLSRLEADLDDGKGYRSVPFSREVTAIYKEAGLKTLRFRVKLSDGSTVVGQSYFRVEQITASGTSKAYNEFWDNLWLMRGASHSGAKVFVEYSTRNKATRRITRPLIVVEGYDANNAYTYEDFIRDIDESNDQGFNFNQALDSLGRFDLIFIDFADGTDDILRQVRAFQQVLDTVNTLRRRTGSSARNVVLGLSMGGLVARYGLAERVSEGRNPRTRLLITHDAPHQGANIPLGFQKLLFMINDIEMLQNQLDEDLQEAFALLQEPATRQLLLVRATDGAGGVAFNTFLSEVYHPMVDRPTPYQVVATSQGAGCGEPSFGPGATLVSGSGKVNAFLTLSPVLGLALMPNFKIVMEAKALPPPGSGALIASLRVTLKIRVLGINIRTVNLHNKKAYAPAEALAWDGASGGVQAITAFAGEVPNEVGILDNEQLFGLVPLLRIFGRFNLGFSQGRFCFVPTPSALDVREINEGTLREVYTWGLSPNAALRQMDNFITHLPFGANDFNETHLAFTAQNARWMFNLMTTPFRDTPWACSETCRPPTARLRLSGSRSICAASEEYRATPIANVGYEWRTSANLSIRQGSGTPTVHLKAEGGGGGWVELRYVNACGILQTLRQEIETAGLATPGPIRSNQGAFYFCQGGFNVLSVKPLEGATSYLWEITPLSEPRRVIFRRSGEVSELLVPDLPTGGYYVRVRASNSCGDSPIRSELFSFTNGPLCQDDPFKVTVQPNPAREVLEVHLEEPGNDNPDPQGNLREEVSLYLLNEKGQEKKRLQTRKKYCRVEVAGLEAGTYYLRAVHPAGEEVIRLRIARE